MKKIAILGQVNQAIPIFLDILRLQYPNEEIQVDIVANLAPEDNETLIYPYETPGIQCREVFHADWKRSPETMLILGSIGKSRAAIFDFFKYHHHIQATDYSLNIHPTAVIAETAGFGYGLHMSPQSTLAPYAALGNFVVINRHVSVGHHTVLEDFVTINPGATVAGICHLGQGVIIGAGAVVIDKVRIGENTLVGAGSVVTKDLPANVVAYGSPAKVVRER